MNKMAIKQTKEGFIQKSNNIHNFEYDYSLVEYINNKTKVRIICNKHGAFEQKPNEHLYSGCPKCSNKNKTNIEFINKFKIIHNNKYDYSLVKFVRINDMIKIICKKHGVFEQSGKYHLSGSGCISCAGVKRYSNVDFIEKSNIIHNGLYDYGMVEYINSHTKIKIICKKHGIFEQMPHKHTLQKQGCPNCRLSKGILKITNLLNTKKIEYKLEESINGCVSKNNIPLRFDIYIPSKNIYIEYDGEQHFRPVENWGGEKSFNDIKERDKLKNEFCRINNLKLFRISYKENIEERIGEIIF